MKTLDGENQIEKEKIIYACPTVSTFLFYTGIVVVLIAIVIPIDFHYGKLSIFKRLDPSIPDNVSLKDYVMYKLGVIETKAEENQVIKNQDRLFTKEELKTFSGDTPMLYLAILGKVFDVTKGVSKYGLNGGYSFFAGIDGSRAYVTGKFDKDGLIDNIEGLHPSDYIGLMDWLKFYEKDYIYVGKLIGYFYDEHGNEREGVKILHEGVKKGEIEKLNAAEDSKLYPRCNSRWTKETGGHIWCSEKSGGIDRSWIGYPRKYFTPGKTNYRCACIKEELFNDPRFKEYEDCPPKGRTCKYSD